LDIMPERHAKGLAEEPAGELARHEEPAMPRRHKAGSLSHVARRVAMVLVVLLVLPYLLIPVYALPFTRPVSTLMLSELFLLRGYDRRWVDIDEISPNLVRAVMMSEDGQFCSHNGVDWRQMRGVVQDALDGEATRGASTISMQTAKNLLEWTVLRAQGARTASRHCGGHALVEATDDGNLSQCRRMGAGHLRDRGGSAALFQDECGKAQHQPGRTSCRRLAQSVQPGCQQAGPGHAQARRRHRPSGAQFRRVHQMHLWIGSRLFIGAIRLKPVA